jgi:RNA polymerase sigma factor for flagellar operon FliA
VSDDALRRLLPTVQRVARHLIRRLPPFVEIDELVQVGLIAVSGALPRYDPSGGASLETFAARRALGGMLDWCRQADPLSRADRRALRAAGETGTPVQPWPVDFDPVDTAPGPLDMLLDRERAARLEVEIARLPDRSREVLRLALAGDLTLAEIGTLFGVSASRAWQIAHDAAALLRARMVTDPAPRPAPPPLPDVTRWAGARVG